VGQTHRGPLRVRAIPVALPPAVDRRGRQTLWAQVHRICVRDPRSNALRVAEASTVAA